MLTTNTKLMKNNVEYVGYGLSLSPHKTSGYNVCTSSTKECRKYCINWSGNGFYPVVQEARINKTKLFFEDRLTFLGELHKSIGAKLDKHPNLAIRLNVFSDIMWEKIDPTLFDYPVQFYDYTKHVKRYERFLRGELPKNYHLCFSRSEKNDVDSERFLEMGGQVTYVFDEIPTEYMGYSVTNGDESDFRFLDPPGIIGLKAKGRLRGKDSEFKVQSCQMVFIT